MVDHLATIDMGRKLGVGSCAPFSLGREAGSPFNTMWPGPRPTFVPLDPSSHLATTDTGRKVGGGRGLCPLLLVPHLTVSPGPRPTSVPNGILIHLAVWPQQTWAENWGSVPLLGELGPHLTQCRLSRILPLYQVASWSIQPLGQNIHGPKTGGGARSSSDTMWPGRGLPPCQVSSWSIQPFGHNTLTLVRQTDNGPIAYGGPFYKPFVQKLSS